MAKGFKDENGKFRPTGNKKVRDISDDGDDVNVTVNVDNIDELEEFAKEKAESVNDDENENSNDIFDEIKVRFNLKSSKPMYRDEDNETGYIGDRYVYDGIVTANGKTKHFEFTDSVANYNAGEEPKPKDLLYSLVMDLSAPEDESDFYSEYGYDPDSRKAEKIFKAVQAEKKKVNDLLTEDQIERLSEALQDY